MSGNFTEIQSITKRKFLNAFVECGGVRRASDKAGISWRNHYHWMKDDPEYVEAFAEAQLMAGDTLEDEAVRRAQDGVEKPIFYKGRKVASVQEYSDSLMVVLLKGNKPEKFRERQDITTAGKALRVTIADSDAI